MSLALPAQELRRTDASYTLGFDEPRPVEGWNAQISLLTGMCAATTMVDGGVGILRTLPPPDDHAVGRLRATARALGLAWPEHVSYPDLVASLDPQDPDHVAFLEQAAQTLRGAGYHVLDGTERPAPVHGAIAAHYAYVTAPLRRLADRYANAVLLELSADRAPSDDLRAALAPLPEIMGDAGRRVHQVERAVVDLAEAIALQGSEGDVFHGVVVDVEQETARVLIRRPPIVASLDADGASLGDEITVRVVRVDAGSRQIELACADSSGRSHRGDRACDRGRLVAHGEVVPPWHDDLSSLGEALLPLRLEAERVVALPEHGLHRDAAKRSLEGVRDRRVEGVGPARRAHVPVERSARATIDARPEHSTVLAGEVTADAEARRAGARHESGPGIELSHRCRAHDGEHRSERDARRSPPEGVHDDQTSHETRSSRRGGETRHTAEVVHDEHERLGELVHHRADREARRVETRLGARDTLAEPAPGCVERDAPMPWHQLGDDIPPHVRPEADVDEEHGRARPGVGERDLAHGCGESARLERPRLRVEPARSLRRATDPPHVERGLGVVHRRSSHTGAGTEEAHAGTRTRTNTAPAM